MARPSKENQMLKEIDALGDVEKLKLFIETQRKRLQREKWKEKAQKQRDRRKSDSLQAQIRAASHLLFTHERKEILKERAHTTDNIDFSLLMEQEIARKKKFYKKLAQQNQQKYREIAIKNGVKLDDKEEHKSKGSC